MNRTCERTSTIFKISQRVETILLQRGSYLAKKTSTKQERVAQTSEMNPAIIITMNPASDAEVNFSAFRARIFLAEIKQQIIEIGTAITAAYSKATLRID